MKASHTREAVAIALNMGYMFSSERLSLIHISYANRHGRWADNPDFCYWDTDLVELDGKKLGICLLYTSIDYYPHLREKLEKMGSGLSCRTYMPAQVQLIVGAIGEP